MIQSFSGNLVNSIIKMESGRAGCYLNRDNNNNIHKRNCSFHSKNEAKLNESKENVYT